MPRHWDSIYKGWNEQPFQRLMLSTNRLRNEITQYCCKNIPAVEMEAVEHVIRDYNENKNYLNSVPISIKCSIDRSCTRFEGESDFYVRIKENLQKNDYHSLVIPIKNKKTSPMKCMCVIKLTSVECREDEQYAVFRYKLGFQTLSWSVEELWSISNEFSATLFCHTDTTSKRRINAIKSLKLSDESVNKIILRLQSMAHDRATSKSISRSHGNLCKPNDKQQEAIAHALDESQKFSVIQGPPGTGKTETAAHIIYHLYQMNRKSINQQKPKILYCAPSNKATDKIIDYLQRLPHSIRPKIIRVLSSFLEKVTYPIPQEGDPFFIRKPFISDETLDKVTRLSNYSHILLHEMIREVSSDIQMYDQMIEDGDFITNKEIRYFRYLIRKEKNKVLKTADVILCTCTASGMAILQNLNIKQVIIDECGMCTDSDCLIPLTNLKPKKIICIGDHQQLQPVVFSKDCVRETLHNTAFEYYSKQNGVTVLNRQYRMHYDICDFPSKTFYDSKLICGTLEQYLPSKLLSFWDNNSRPKVFLDIVGIEKRNLRNGSFYNKIEANLVVQLLNLLIYRERVKGRDIMVLTYYRAQVVEIQNAIRQSRIVHNFNPKNVQTIITSQGSEWKYVIISCVRSVEGNEYPDEPSEEWRRRHIGFLDDYHQQNVCITRAKDGLIIIGDASTLNCCDTWRKLISDYTETFCFEDAANFN
ncbi:DgyrCDS10571 [Dimorphilus gyrociliatus]|uniref:DgyrCDS10571 n=1 Tax=Dimorphilus gyrociliatus TaxID=2664684 RepID=A0A7I8W0R4_9ANNE|nr:DgyrCDS10571 [Dimorphilus gyrociliatus]